MIDFYSVEQRIERAGEHVEALRSQVDTFLESRPYRRDTRATEAGNLVERAEHVRPAPISLSLTVSDALHQARAALDNVVGAIRPGGPTDTSSFPIHRDAEGFARVAARALEGVPEWAVETIAAMQPYSDDHRRYVGEELVDLHDLARFDRHRAPRLSTSLVRIDYVEGETVAMRGDWRTWAEVEYVPGKVAQVHFKAVVQFVDEPLAGWDVVSGTGMLVNVAAAAVQQLKQAFWRQPRSS